MPERDDMPPGPFSERSLPESTPGDLYLRRSAEALRTRYTTVKGYAQLLQRKLRTVSQEEDLRTLVDHLDDEMAQFEQLLLRCVHVCDLTFASDNPSVGVIDLHAVAQQVVEQCATAPERTSRHVLALTGEPPIMGRWYGEWVAGALADMVSNALKYSPNGGQITISVRRDAGVALLTVQDEGIGIPHAFHSRIFQPFVRHPEAARIAPGFGLGLFVADQVCRRHGGSIEVASKPSRGSTFTLRLPIAPAEYQA